MQRKEEVDRSGTLDKQEDVVMESQREQSLPIIEKDCISNCDRNTVEEDLSTEYGLEHIETSGYHRYEDDDSGNAKVNWKHFRPSFSLSLFYCTACAFSATILIGIPGGLFTSVLTLLDLRLAEACYDTAWNLIPVGIQRIRLTAQVVEGMFIQFWSFSAIVLMFGWKKTSELNIPIWNVFGASCDGLYRLFLNTYGVYKESWVSYPLNVLFVAITSFNFYRITAAFERDLRQRIVMAVKLGMPFLMGTPMFLLMNYFLFPAYEKFPSDNTKAVFSVLLPAVFIIPKAVINVCLVDLHEVCSPGYSSVLVVGFHTMTTIVARYLQASIEEIRIFVGICFAHGFETLFDKLTLNLRMKAYRTFCKSCVGNGDSNQDKKRMLAMNRILAEQSLSGMILETDTIFMSCGLIGILRYYYGNDSPSWDSLLKVFAVRVIVASIIEFLFNVVSVKVQTYYFNIPVLRVWRRRWWWVILGIVTYTAYTTLYCSEYLYRPVLSHGIYNYSKVLACSDANSIF